MNLTMLAKFNEEYIQDTSEVGFKFLILTLILIIIYRHSLPAFVIVVIGGCYIANSSEFFSKYIFDMIELGAAAFITFFIGAPIFYLIKGPPKIYE